MAGEELSTESRLMALFAVLFATFVAGSCSGQVPLVMWSDGGDTFPPLAAPLAGHIMSGSQWLSYLNSAVGPGPHNILIFLQEKLSKDDFTMYGGVFGNKQDSAFLNLEALLEAAPSQLVLPAVSWEGSSATPALLQDRLGVSAVLIDPDTPAPLQLNPSESNLLIVSLPYCTGFSSSASCKQVLQSNDEVIGKVVSSMKAQDVSYTAIYTGLRPSRMIEEALVSGRSKGRALLQTMEDPVKPPLMFNNTDGNTCIMLWAQNLTVSFGGAGWVDLAPSAPTMDGSLCNGTISKLVLNYRNVSLYGDLSLTFSMSQRRYPVSARNWFTLDAVDVTHPNGSASFNGSRGIYAPAEYSFNCQSVSSLRNGLLVAALSTPAQWRLNFTDFQIQGFGILNGTSDFSYASDCAGFFTPGIWMGLITSLLMLLILTYGLHMIMQLRTMDRFDDPKGPSISVPQSE